MSAAAAAAILDGMPDPQDLHRLDNGGETVIFAGSAELFRFAEDDSALRHVAAAALRQLGFSGRDVAAVLGLSAAYVATLHQRALRGGTAALIRPAGRPPETGEKSWEQARQWRAAGVRDAEIARRLQVSQPTVLRHLGRAHVQDPLPEAEPQDAEAQDTDAEAAGAGVPEPGSRSAAPAGDGQRPAGQVTVRSRYAGAMLLHAFASRAGAGDALAAAAGADAPDDVVRPRSARASRWGPRRPSSSSTWRRPRPGRWPGCPGCRGCGRCGRGWPRSRTAPTRWSCSGCSPPRCWPRTR
jgi:hypothetical protein